MEEKETKKKTNTKTTKSKTTQSKKTTSKKTTTNTKTTNTPKTRTRKTSGTSTSTKKKSPSQTIKKKTTSSELPKKQVKKTTVKTEKTTEKKDNKIANNEEKDILLEKTIIFDGVQSKNLSDVVNKLEEDNIVLEDKVIKRSKVRKVLIIILILTMIAVAGITAKYVKDEIAELKRIKETLNSDIYAKASEKYNSEEDIKDTENSDIIQDIKYENIETITLSEFEKKALNKEDMVVLVASTTCYSCITFEPIIDEVFKEIGKTIYRINITSMATEDVARFRTYYAFKSTPTIFVIKNGVVVSDARGATNAQNLREWLDENL